MAEISRNALFGKLNPTTYRAIESATVFCKLRGNPYVELVHWLHQLLQLEDSDLHRIVRHFGARSTPMRAWIYGQGRGSPLGNERAYIDRFVEHNRRVRTHFSARQHDLLVMDITAGDGWEALCPFLGREVPDIPFPRLNQRDERN